MIFERLSNKISAAFKSLRSKGKLSEQDVKNAMREIKLALLEADVNFNVVRDFIAQVQELAISQEVLKSLTPGQQVVKIVNAELIKLLGAKNEKIKFTASVPTVIMMCGLQGSGKTTHSAKVAYSLKAKGRRPMLVACDIYRPAAIEQLKLAGERAKVFVFEEGKRNPVEIAEHSVKYAKDNGYDVVILDTAGRLHIDNDLMDELVQIKKAVTVNETLLVVDAMTGQDAVNVAQKFDELIGVDGVVLTKLDGDARGGAAVSVAAVTKKPIKFIGVGEKLEDLEEFFPDRMASRILGMGDVLSFIERAEATFDAEQKQKMEKNLAKGRFDLNVFLSQMEMIKKLGSLKSLASMLPGVGKKVTDEQMEQGEKELVRMKAIIYSMTPQERATPSILNASRKKRIAKGSGQKVEDINGLLKKFEAINETMKRFDRLKRPKKKHK
ncbi:MAG: signal recognition particle protein [Oscillospiraceae bacterium]